MLIDLAINAFGADVPDMLEAASLAEETGYACLWVTDHFSGAVVGRDWTRDPFVCLGAMAAVTERIELGVLVANVVNRHPAQLASAVNSLQSFAPGRIRLGVGSGAAPGSRFAVEHEAIGRSLGTAGERRRVLIDSIGALRAIWRGDEAFDAPEVGFDGLRGVVDGARRPPIVVGASAWETVEVALAHADGVNLRVTGSLDGHLTRLRAERPAGFEVSVLDGMVAPRADRSALSTGGCDRLILGISTPFDRSTILGSGPDTP